MGMEAYLDNLFAEGAKEKLKQSEGTIYNYRLTDDNYRLKKKGRCTVINRYYSSSLDCDILVIEDIDTKERITDHIFNLSIEE